MTKEEILIIKNEIMELAKFHSEEIPIRHGDGTEKVDKIISLSELETILDEMVGECQWK